MRPQTNTRYGMYVLLSVLVLGAIGVWYFMGGERVNTSPESPVSEESPMTPEDSLGTKPATTIVAFGDSITAGYGLLLNEAYPAELERALKERGYSVLVQNAGVSGETTAGGLRRASFVASQSPDIVILALGGNDVLRGIPPETTKENLRGIIKIFKENDIAVIIAGMYAPANLGDEYQEAFDALYGDIAQEFSLPLIPFLLEGVALDPALNQSDGIHPNVEGAKRIAREVVLPVLLPLLEE